MFLTTHVLIPVTAEVLLAQKNRLKLTKSLIISTAIGSLLPDVDLFLAPSMINHHQSLWHAPLVWIAVFGIAMLAAKIFHALKFTPVIIGLSIGTLSHMLLDTFGVALGIAWLAPFSWQEYSFTPLTPVTDETWVGVYLKSRVFAAEIVLTILSGAFLIRARKFLGKIFLSS